MPKAIEEYKGEKIGRFLNSIKTDHTNLSEDQKKELLELDSNVFENSIDVQKNRKCDLLLEFHEKKGRWPKKEEQYEGENLGAFLSSIRNRATNLSEDQKNKLLELDQNIFENQIDLQKNKKFNLLLEFYEENKRWPKREEEYKGEKLRTFLDSIKIGDTNLSKDQKDKLLELDPNIFENPKRIEINLKYNLLLEFYEEKGRMPKQKEKYEGENLGGFLSGIKAGDTNLSKDQRDKLLELDPNVFEDPRKTGVNLKYGLLLEFYQEKGRMPKQKEKYEGENLGTFVSRIKSGATSLSEDQKNKLLELDPTLVIKEKELKKKVKDVKNLKKETETTVNIDNNRRKAS